MNLSLEELKRQKAVDPELDNSLDILRARMRSGELPEQYVRWASDLGNKDCRILFPSAGGARVYFVLKHIDKMLCVQFATWCAKKVLHIWEEKFPDDLRPRKAIEAAENYLKNTEFESKRKAFHAGRQSYAAGMFATRALMRFPQDSQLYQLPALAAKSASKAADCASTSSDIINENRNKIKMFPKPFVDIDCKPIYSRTAATCANFTAQILPQTKEELLIEYLLK